MATREQERIANLSCCHHKHQCGIATPQATFSRKHGFAHARDREIIGIEHTCSTKSRICPRGQRASPNARQGAAAQEVWFCLAKGNLSGDERYGFARQKVTYCRKQNCAWQRKAQKKIPQGLFTALGESSLCIVRQQVADACVGQFTSCPTTRGCRTCRHGRDG